MKFKLQALGLTLVALAFTGCGPSRKEIEARERARIEAEKKAQAEIKASNDAVNAVSKKLGRNTQPLDLNLPAQEKPEPVPESAKKP